MLTIIITIIVIFVMKITDRMYPRFDSSVIVPHNNKQQREPKRFDSEMATNETRPFSDAVHGKKKEKEEESIDDIITRLEDEEMNRTSEKPMLKMSDEEMFATLLLAYATKNQTSNAYFLWKRLDHNVKRNSNMLKKTWDICRGLYNRDAVYTFQAMKKAESCYAKDDAMKKMLERLRSTYRESQLLMLTSAYTRVSPKTVAEMIGMSPNQAKSLCVEERGWTYDKSTDTLQPVSGAVANVATHDRGIDHLTHLTKCINYLEAKSTTDFDLKRTVNA